MKSLENLENEYIGTPFGKTDIESVELVETVEVSKIPTIKQTFIEVDSESDNFSIEGTVITPKYVTNSLRQSNYDTESALSELVANSIDAEADIINIVIPSKEELKSGKKAILIHDDGVGMTLDQLKKSFSFGSNREYSIDDIGHYGIGMKAAMAYLSQHVTIETKRKDDDFISVAIWDIDNDPLNRTFLTKKNDDENFISGTKIQMYCKWGDTKKSRLEDFSHTQPAYITKLFAARYFKALDKIKTSPNGDSLPKMKILINGSDIIPFDPLYRLDKNVKNFREDIEILVDNKKYTIILDGYYLGYVEPDGFDKSIKKNGFTFDRQGVYLLLNGIYIQIGGNWLGCRQAQHAINATRIEVDIPKELIEYFGISMNKNSVINLKNSSEETSLSTHSEKSKVINAINMIATLGLKAAAEQSDKEKKNITLEKIDQANDLTKNLNKKVKDIGLTKPSEGINKLPETLKKTTTPKGGTKDRPSDLKYNKDLFRIDLFDGEKLGSFWKLEREGKKTIICINSNHAFYDKYINSESSALIIELLCAMALSELNTYTDDSAQDNWEEFWFNVSRWVNKFNIKEIK
jgi:hypothetical protein